MLLSGNISDIQLQSARQPVIFKGKDLPEAGTAHMSENGGDRSKSNIGRDSGACRAEPPTR
jgi:hypothetical protein